jgi:hypothetical protein
MITVILLLYKIHGVKYKRDGGYMIEYVEVIIGGHQFEIEIMLNDEGKKVTGNR